MTNQYALGYKAGLEAAVKVVHRFINGDGLAEPFMSDVAEAIAALPVLVSSQSCAEVQWRDLTDDDIKAAYESWWEEHGNHAFPIWVGAKAVIAKFKEKQL